MQEVKEVNEPEPSASMPDDIAAIGNAPTNKFLAMQDDVSSDE